MEMTRSYVTSSSTVDTTDPASMLPVEDEDADDNDDQDEEEDDEPINAPSTNTMLHDKDIDPTNTTLTFTPGEGKRPVFHEPLAEYLCFPTIFCGQQRAPNSERIHPVQQRDIFKYELRSVDTRVASNIPNIFWKAKHKQVKQICDKVSLAVRRNKTKGTKITASMLLDKEQRNNIVKLDEGYYIFHTIRNSPAYFETKKKDVMAMVCQLSIPTIFFSLSAADTKWTNLLISLGKLLHNVTYTKSDIENMTWEEKCTLISSHPAACARYFHNRVQKFFKYVLHSPHSPFGHLEDFFYRIEFQHRGSPHVHGLLWIKGAPKFDVNSDLEVCAYIASIIACTSNVSEEEQPYVQFQKHHHSKPVTRNLEGRKFVDLEHHGHQ